LPGGGGRYGGLISLIMTKSAQRWLGLGATALVLGLIVYHLTRSPEWRTFNARQLWLSMAGARPAWLLLAVAATYTSYLVRALRWKYFLEPIKRASLWTLFAGQILGFSSIYLIGRPGELVRPGYIARKEHVSFASQLAILLLERIYDTVAVILLFGLALYFQPLPPAGPRSGAVVNALAFSPTPIFDGSEGDIQSMVLTGDVNSSSLVGAQAGQRVRFRIIQDAAGRHRFAWPANTVGAPAVNQGPRTETDWTCLYDGSRCQPVVDLHRLRSAAEIVMVFSLLLVLALVAFRLNSESLVASVDRRFGFLPARIRLGLEGFLRHLAQGLDAIRHWRDLAASVVWTVVLWLLNASVFWLVFRSLGGELERISWWAAAIVIFFGGIGLLVQLPGVGGGFQVAIIEALKRILHVGTATATSSGILLWIVIFVPCVALAVVILLYEGLSFKKLRHLAEEKKAEAKDGSP
jgi:uncharacterized membrane protein YbhN (UPF0104 family)